MTDDDFKLWRDLITDERTDRQKDICVCRVTFMTEKILNSVSIVH